jgi:hypothetical protein
MCEVGNISPRRLLASASDSDVTLNRLAEKNTLQLFGFVLLPCAMGVLRGINTSRPQVPLEALPLLGLVFQIYLNLTMNLFHL